MQLFLYRKSEKTYRFVVKCSFSCIPTQLCIDAFDRLLVSIVTPFTTVSPAMQRLPKPNAGQIGACACTHKVLSLYKCTNFYSA